LTSVRDSGRNSAPLGRVTRIPRLTATTVLATAAQHTVPNCASASASRFP